METRRLELLVSLSRLGSMTAVAEELRTTTSTVSAQLAILAREAGTALLEPAGRRVRLTPAGHRLVDHAREVLAALDAALSDLGPAAAPHGRVRIAGFATAIRRSVLPALPWLAAHEAGIDVTVSELEPEAALSSLLAGDTDIALVFDYSLHPWQHDPAVSTRQLWTATWGLLVPAADPTASEPTASEPTAMQRLHQDSWIVDSRTGADEDVLRTLSAGVDQPARLLHKADDLALVHDLVAAGLGVALHPLDRPVGTGVRLVELPPPGITLRCWAAARRGHDTWPPVAAVLDALQQFSSAVPLSRGS